MSRNSDGRPWYREPWPWLLMLGPFVVVLAGIYTAWLAVSTSDGLVTDDYYKKGLKVDQTIAADAQARAQGIEARVSVTAGQLAVRLSATVPGFAAPPRLSVSLSHPTRAGVDQSRLMTRGEGDRYVASFQLPASGHWLVGIEDEAKTWRLLGKVMLPADGEIVIGGGSASADFRHP